MILLVEDEPGVAFLEREVLERAGFEVEQVGCGEEAIACLEGNRSMALVVLDYILPDMNGAEVLARLEERPGDLPVVVVTGYPDPGVEQQMKNAGAYEYLKKDIELEFLDRLPQVVRSALDGIAGTT